MSIINSTTPSTSTSGTAGSVQVQARPMVAKPPVTPSSDVALAAQAPQAEVSKEEVKQIVKEANIQLANVGNEHVSFGYEERLNLLYVQIKDTATGEVVREIPSRDVIEQKAAMSEMIGIILDRNA